jgi:hypothetical protein
MSEGISAPIKTQLKIEIDLVITIKQEGNIIRGYDT